MDYRIPSHLKTLPPHLRNYYFYRERDFREPSWIRPADLKDLDLPRPIVLVNGAFDLLHSTHMRLLFNARNKAATLICALDSDEKIKRDKDERRPILNFIERLTSLNYMPLDYIIQINNKNDMDQVVSTLHPDLRVQGEDYANHKSRYPTKRMFVREGKIHTSEIIGRVLHKYDI